jgi:hypothetical protein
MSTTSIAVLALIPVVLTLRYLVRKVTSSDEQADKQNGFHSRLVRAGHLA